jgi:site-specific DNA-methyltransferase (adenine-specific)
MIDEAWEVILVFYRPGFNEGGQERIGEKWATKGYWDDIPGVNLPGHPAAYSPDIARRFILLYSVAGDYVVDPFLGSGSTAVAAEQIDRICLGMELSPEYLAVALERMSTLGLPISLEEAYEPAASG